MDENTLLRNHAYYQKSWTGWSCDHAKATPRDTTSSRYSQSDAESLGSKGDNLKLKEGKAIRASRANKLPSLTLSRQTPRARRADRADRASGASSSRSAMSLVHVSVDPLTSRRSKRSTRSRPWQEKVPRASHRSDDFEMVYESFLPKDTWVEFRARQYVTNPRYGQLYEVRREKPRPKPQDPPPTWLWEDNYRLWRFEMANTAAESSEKGRKKGGVSDVSRRTYVNSRPSKLEDISKPHADLFAAYHNQKLTNQRRHLAATAIQRQVRGWLVRMRIKEMKRQALLGLGRAWPKVTREYRELVTRTQARHGVMKTSCQFTLPDMEDYLHKREKYERVFERVAIGDKLSREQLPTFLEECGHFPTEGEITTAFNAVFRGSGSAAEVVMVLDCSSSLGQVNFDHQMTFVKDVVRSLHIGPDRVRVALVPFNTHVFQAFGLLQHSTQKDILHAIDQIQFRPGLTHTDIALKVMRDVFKDARPGVQKIGVVITDGQSANTQRTALEAKKAADDNITVFAIGVGHYVGKEELQNIARDASRVFLCSSYSALVDLKHLISTKLCLRSCTLCQHILPRVQLHGLYKAETMEILFTLFPPPATLRSLPPHSPTSHHPHPSDVTAQGSDATISNLTSPWSAYDIEGLGDGGHVNDGSPGTKTTSGLSTSDVKGSNPEMTSELSTADVKESNPDAVSKFSETGSKKKTDKEMTGGVSTSGKERADLEVTSEKGDASSVAGSDGKVTTSSLHGVGAEGGEQKKGTVAPLSSADSDDRDNGDGGGRGGRSVLVPDLSTVPRYDDAERLTHNLSDTTTTTTTPSTNNIHTTTSTTTTSSTHPTTITTSSSKATVTTKTPNSSASDVESKIMDNNSSNSSHMKRFACDNGNNEATGTEGSKESAGGTTRAGDNKSITVANRDEEQETIDVTTREEPDKSTDVTTKEKDKYTSPYNDDANNNSNNVSKVDERDEGVGVGGEGGGDEMVSKGTRSEGARSEVARLDARGTVQDVCRPLTKGEALDVVWTLHPPPATLLQPPPSRWIRPLVDGEEAWSLLDESIIKATDFKVCLGLVVKARLEREGVVTIPSDVRAGVEEVTSYEEAMQKIEEYLAHRAEKGHNSKSTI